MIDKILKGLNEEQRMAASNIHGSSMIIAGPGAGKTHTLVARTALMISKGIPSNNIILFTFTKKAANEIKQRIKDRIGARAENITVGTYHSVCNKFLRKYATILGYEKNFSIYDSKDCELLIKEIIKQNGYSTIDVSDALYKISDYKCNMITPVQALKEAKSSTEKALATIYDLYEIKLKKKNAMDFDNLIFKTITLLEDFPEIKEKINKQYQYIIADESHDSSIMDLRLIRGLAGDLENLCMILDEEQSIYSFRGARIEAVMNMRNIYPKMKTFILSSNYRSTQTIVGASRSLIDNNKKYLEKNLESKNEEGNPIIHFTERSQDSEAERVVKLVKLCVDKYGYNYNDIAVLYRMNYLSRAVEDALLKYKVPYKILGGTSFYDREEIKDIMSYFRVILNPNDTLAFKRTVNTPKRGIGESSVEKIIKYSEENECTIMEAVEAGVGECIKLTAKTKKSLSDYHSILQELKNTIDEEETRDCIIKMLDLTNYLDYVKEKKGEAADSKIQNINELLEIALMFDTIEELSENITLDSSIDKDDDEDNNVQLLTMHSSKGLEWSVVIIVGAIEGVTPSYRADTSERMEEERRLFYVASTRARKLLFTTMPQYSLQRGNYVKNLESRFIKEIDEQFIYRYAEEK